MLRELLPVQHFVHAVRKSIGLSDDCLTTIKTTIWEDNAGALTLTQMEPSHKTPQFKHYAAKYHWFRLHLKQKKCYREH
jgi:hypothetical protein